MNARHHFVACALVLAGTVTPLRADSDGEALEKLRLQVQALQERVSALESMTTFTTFMPDFAERFHVMHRAGEAGDWAVASHELGEMQRMARLSRSIDGEKGRLLDSMMAPGFAALDDAIKHGNGSRFEAALGQAVTACNACHTATGSSFIEVTLDVPDLLSLRHPHRLVARQVPGGHSHEMPAAGSGTTQRHDAPGHGHGDAGKSRDKH